MNVKVLFGGKNVVVGELDKALEVLATAFGFELDFVLLDKAYLVFLFMSEAMPT